MFKFKAVTEKQVLELILSLKNSTATGVDYIVSAVYPAKHMILRHVQMPPIGNNLSINLL